MQHCRNSHTRRLWYVECVYCVQIRRIFYFIISGLNNIDLFKCYQSFNLNNKNALLNARNSLFKFMHILQHFRCSFSNFHNFGTNQYYLTSKKVKITRMEIWENTWNSYLLLLRKLEKNFNRTLLPLCVGICIPSRINNPCLCNFILMRAVKVRRSNVKKLH